MRKPPHVEPARQPARPRLSWWQRALAWLLSDRDLR